MTTINTYTAVLWLIFLNVVLGFSFPMMDYLLTQVSAFKLLFIHYIISTIVLFIMYAKQLKNTSKRSFRLIFLISAFDLLGTSAQTLGLSLSSSTNTAFINSLSVLILPIILKLSGYSRIGQKKVIGIFLATMGISAMALQADMTFSKGDVLAFAGTICFSFLYYFLGKYGAEVHAGVLTATQSLLISVVSLPFCFQKGSGSLSLNPKTIFYSIFIIFVCLIFASVMHNKVQHYIPTAIVGIIFLIEPVAASTLAWLMGETISFRQVIGAILVIISIVFTIETSRREERW